MTTLPPSISSTHPLPEGCTWPESEWRILARHWHPIAYSDEVIDKPLPRILLDEELIVYRTTAKQVVVAQDLCIHRGVPLKLGWQEGDELVCAYHGFRYGADGRCTRVPAQPELPVPAKLCLKTFPVIERYGLIWTCLNPAPADSLPEWPELEDDSYRMIHDAPIEWKASAGRQLENFLDVAHFAWTHAGTFGNRDRPEVPAYEVERGPGTLHVDYRYLAANPDHSPVGGKERSPTIERRMIYDLHVPFACRLIVDYGQGRHHCIFNIPTPASRKQVRIFFFVARNYDHHVPTREILDWENKILAEDKPIVENQKPEQLPLDLTEEFHIRCDRLSTAYRHALQALGLGPGYTA